ncbi:glucose-1-phosphate adenylyltransferase [bacterium]|nr:glucose-1-phosphate adenylyltransferase [bacterium]
MADFSGDNVLGVILGGGRGERLFPLTKFRSKPAVPLAGKYRLVDIPISNCINSGITKVFVLTQYNSASLNRHVNYAYRFDQFSGGFVDILAAEQNYDEQGWFEGTADAVRRVMRHLETYSADYILILSGDQLYQMDLRRMLQQHVERDSDVTVAACAVTEAEAPSLGVLRTDPDGRIVEFREKPPREELDRVRMDATTIARAGISDRRKAFLGSMGIYVFSLPLLADVLAESKERDFGKHVIPRAIREHRVHAFIHEGYWEDIGTIRTFYNANLALADHMPDFDFYRSDSRIFSRARFLPPTKMFNTRLDRALVADGCIVGDSEVVHSIVGLRNVVKKSRLEGVVMMGCDYYEWETLRRKVGDTSIPLGIGEGCRISNAIIDKNARIGPNVTICNQRGLVEADGENFYIRDSIVIIPKNAVVHPGTTI